MADEDEHEHKAMRPAAKRSAASASLDGPPGTSTALVHVLCSHGDCRVKAISATGNYISINSIKKKFKPGATAPTAHFCSAHGGGRRCTFDGCNIGAQGKTAFCSAHGGGGRCTFDGCNIGAQGGTAFCSAHGGGHRCSYPDCQSGARSKDIGLCATHSWRWTDRRSLAGSARHSVYLAIPAWPRQDVVG